MFKKAIITGIILLFYTSLFSQGDTVKVKMADEQEAEKTYNSGLQLFKEKNYNGAIAAFTKTIGLKPNFDKAFYNRALAFIELNKDQEALADLDRTISLRDSADYAYLQRAALLMKSGKSTDAEKDINKALALNPKNADAYYHAGVMK